MTHAGRGVPIVILDHAEFIVAAGDHRIVHNPASVGPQPERTQPALCVDRRETTVRSAIVRKIRTACGANRVLRGAFKNVRPETASGSEQCVVAVSHGRTAVELCRTAIGIGGHRHVCVRLVDEWSAVA
eukprot:3520804-Prymnesium_polylepis.1